MVREVATTSEVLDMVEHEHTEWVMRFLAQSRDINSGHVGVRMKELRETFPLAFDKSEVSSLDSAVNHLVKEGKLLAVDIEYASIGERWGREKRRVCRADIITNVAAVQNAMLYGFDVAIPRQVRIQVERQQKRTARALAALPTTT